jgi:hypothetical protein
MGKLSSFSSLSTPELKSGNPDFFTDPIVVVLWLSSSVPLAWNNKQRTLEEKDI